MSDLAALFAAMRASDGTDADLAAKGRAGRGGAPQTAPGGGFTPDPRFAISGPPPRARSAHAGQPCPTDPLPEPAPEPAPEPPPDPLDLARAEGFIAGHAAARAEAEAEAARTGDAAARLALAFSRLDAEMAEQLRQRLIETVAALCEATLAPLALDRDLLATRVARAVAMFTRADDERVIRLNPDDLEAVRAALPADWTFLPDPALVPGALRVETASGGAEDGPVQWRRAIAQALDPAVGQ